MINVYITCINSIKITVTKFMAAIMVLYMGSMSPFQKLIWEISQEYWICPQGLGTPSMQVRFQSTATVALQEAAENFILGLFEDVNQLAVHAKRVTVIPRDIRLLLRIHRDHYRWQITLEDAAHYEWHNRRKANGGGLPIILWWSGYLFK